MPWKCPSCGFDNPEGCSECEGGCGYVPIPARLILTALATGKIITIAITTSFGKSLLQSFAGDEAIYASEPRFVLRKDSSRGGWYLEHLAAAKNPTFVNGAPAAAEAAKLAASHVVSIGPDKMRLEVSFS